MPEALLAGAVLPGLVVLGLVVLGLPVRRSVWFVRVVLVVIMVSFVAE